MRERGEDPAQPAPKRPARTPKGPSGPGGSDISREGSYNAGLAVFSYIIGGIIVWTLIGWGLDNLLGTSWIVLAGAFLGAAGGFYLSYVHGLTRRTAQSESEPNSDADAADGPQQ